MVVPLTRATNQNTAQSTGRSSRVIEKPSRKSLSKIGGLSAGALISLGAASQAQATPVSVPVNDTLVFNASTGAVVNGGSGSATGTTVSYDLNGDGIQDILFSVFNGNSGNPDAPGNGVSVRMSEDFYPYGQSTSPTAFSFGDLIPHLTPTITAFLRALALNVNLTTGTGDGNFFNLAQSKFLGFSFLDFTDNTDHTAWANLNVTYDHSSGNYSVHVGGFGYESQAGTDIVAGVPEPSSLALLALGAAGLGLRRRGQNRKAAAGATS